MKELAIPESSVNALAALTSPTSDNRIMELEARLELTERRVNDYARALGRIVSEQAALEAQLGKQQSTLGEMRSEMDAVLLECDEASNFHSLVSSAREQTEKLEKAMAELPFLSQRIASRRNEVESIEKHLERIPVLHERMTQLTQMLEQSDAAQQATLSDFAKILADCPLLEKLQRLETKLASLTSSDESSLLVLEGQAQSSCDTLAEEMAAKTEAIEQHRKVRDDVLQKVFSWLETHTHYQTPEQQLAFRAYHRPSTGGSIKKEEVTGDVRYTGVSSTVFRV